MKGVILRSAPAPADLTAVKQRLFFNGKYSDQSSIDLLFRSRRTIRGGVYCQLDNDSFGAGPVIGKSSATRCDVSVQVLSSPISEETTATINKRVFTFGKGKSEGNKSMKSLLGGKGANLAEMATIGLSVPAGLTISTEACQEYQKNGLDGFAETWSSLPSRNEIGFAEKIAVFAYLPASDLELQ
ncbi:Pyruvate, phosphate dikinase, chloroplastic, partial [Linum perenne]